ncbi:hypothetical protein [uncultured Thiodictyon sp.]|uniref:hypothetical protein n=1 Tax=uncultured Thiodictyon sp. TaxID=1846217 RepID=UPI0025FD8CFA|nr:hypothetical protein [uncultured Thiodictyon sp.]
MLATRSVENRKVFACLELAIDAVKRRPIIVDDGQQSTRLKRLTTLLEPLLHVPEEHRKR